MIVSKDIMNGVKINFAKVSSQDGKSALLMEIEDQNAASYSDRKKSYVFCDDILDELIRSIDSVATENGYI